MVGLTLLYSFSLCCAEVMADSTDSRFTRDLMFDAVPYSSASIFWTRATCVRGTRLAAQAPWMHAPRPSATCRQLPGRPARAQSQPNAFLQRVAPCCPGRTWSFGGMIRLIMLVPLPLAVSSALMSCAQECVWGGRPAGGEAPALPACLWRPPTLPPPTPPRGGTAKRCAAGCAPA